MKLIKLPEGNIIVSDDRIKIEDWLYNLESLEIVMFFGGFSKYVENPFELNWRKLIASDNPKHNLPSIDYNGFEEKLGIVDIEKLAKECADENKSRFNNWYGCHTGFINGFNKAQSLNDKKYALEDMKKAFKAGRDNGENKSELNINDFIQSLNQPKVFDIEVERYDSECQKPICDDNCSMPDCLATGQPKITNNTIKITAVN